MNKTKNVSGPFLGLIVLILWLLTGCVGWFYDVEPPPLHDESSGAEATGFESITGGVCSAGNLHCACLPMEGCDAGLLCSDGGTCEEEVADSSSGGSTTGDTSSGGGDISSSGGETGASSDTGSSGDTGIGSSSGDSTTGGACEVPVGPCTDCLAFECTPQVEVACPPDGCPACAFLECVNDGNSWAACMGPEDPLQDCAQENCGIECTV